MYLASPQDECQRFHWFQNSHVDSFLLKLKTIWIDIKIPPPCYPGPLSLLSGKEMPCHQNFLKMTHEFITKQLSTTDHSF